MTRAQERPPAFAGVRLLSVLVLVIAFVAGPIFPTEAALAAACFGDEQLLMAPADPHPGDALTVAAVSRFPHEHGVLSGPTGALETTAITVGDRFVWQSTLVPDAPSDLTFSFGVVNLDGAVIQCAQAVAVIRDAPAAIDTVVAGAPSGTPESSALFASLHPWQAGSIGQAASSVSPGAADPGAAADATSATGSKSQAADQPRATSTRRPTRTPSRQTESDNGNENDNESDPTATKIPTPTRTPTSVNTPRPTSTPRPTDTPRSTNTPRPAPTDTPAPTPTLGPPEIAMPSIGVICGQPMTIRGERLGGSQKDVSGKVTVDGRETTVLSWSMSEIEVRVPLTARPGNERQVNVTVNGQTVSGVVQIRLQ